MINLLAGVVAVVFTIIMSQGIALSFGVPVTVIVNKQIVYSGNSSCIQLSKGGAVTSTKVEIRDGFMCLMPAAQYVSTDVQVTTK